MPFADRQHLPPEQMRPARYMLTVVEEGAPIQSFPYGRLDDVQTHIDRALRRFRIAVVMGTALHHSVVTFKVVERLRGGRERTLWTEIGSYIAHGAPYPTEAITTILEESDVG